MTATTRTTFDAVIVGAGLAGSTAAIQLARGGWAVALIERQRFPRRKVCGECIAASNLPLLQALGVGDAFHALAGPELRRVTLLQGERAVTADLPPADHDRYAWGRALGRDTLDGLLLDQARAAGATVFQPWAVQTIRGTAGAWHCELRALDSAALLRLRATVVIDAHGSWEDLPADRPRRRLARSAADLFAFKANFTGSSVPEGAISVLALDGGYGGMVVADGGTTTVACCIRRDRLSALRAAAPGLRAGDAVEAWLQRECGGVQRALQWAVRDGHWLTSGPLDPGVHLEADDGIFRIGNAAGEAHPILGEGMSVALQSAALLGSVLLGRCGAAAVPDATVQPELQRRYAAAWRKAFAPRLRLAAVFAHLAMRPRSSEALMKLVRIWPGLLTRGARWGGKVRFAEPTGMLGPRAAAEARPVAGSAMRAP
ncbi:MAG: FAD-dependent oxidoreductase [Rubrivivax sp.]|nr:FAD-dependent oxidoreductase [Rubrivivax sp.]